MDAFVHGATYTFAYDSATVARIIERSVRPEVGDIDDERSQVSLSRSESTIEVTVEATDLVALRAASNTWLTLVDVAESVADCGRACR
ncbi:KEOPS complex subunit Pcc1 [Natranaeroarchaeum aerophilus]|uniref:KEOPS complex Pcc1-like subunit n=1 Tax=Natranaeroarchaeum aerophilus TaxID=2917711 RepID=A0AAE3FU34_9EURY|nr:KEOPS complex subunit Pcc1 [Natranaeroarchaeum aerophilus]MCL9815145.1 hypothetical protein [Natranaeroarchaeum aerophilus]